MLDSLSLGRGTLLLPAFLPDATLGVVRTLDSEDVEACGIDAVVTSHEPKAVGTGRVLAAELGVPASTAPDLEEHHRAGRRLMDEAEWQRTLKRFFANPDVLLFGTETGAEARARFERGVRAALAERPGKRLALVSHATVMTLLLAGPNGLDPYELWRTVRMPEAFVVRADDLRIVERVALPD